MEKSFPDYEADEYNTGTGTDTSAGCHFGLGFHAGVMHELIQSDLVRSLKEMFPLASDEFLRNEVSIFFHDGYYFDENGNSVTESEMLARLVGRLLKAGISETTDGRSGGATLNAAESQASTTSLGFGTQLEANFDCGCCFTSSPASVQVTCDQGHAFCQSCVKRYVNFIVSGEGSSSFVCMSDGCSAGFSTSSLHFVEPRRLKQLEERQQSEDVAKALAFSSTDEQLHQCPFCDFKCVIPNGNKVFECHNPSCKKQSCKLCKKIWEGHLGLPCDEVEAKDESDLRTRTEEAMTKAVVRRCLKCNTPFIKDEGWLFVMR